MWSILRAWQGLRRPHRTFLQAKLEVFCTTKYSSIIGGTHSQYEDTCPPVWRHNYWFQTTGADLRIRDIGALRTLIIRGKSLVVKFRFRSLHDNSTTSRTELIAKLNFFSEVPERDRGNPTCNYSVIINARSP